MADRSGAALAIDIGGTFTDVVLVDGNGRLHRAKSLTSPADPISGVLVGVRAVLERSGVRPEDVERTVHGTTLATNVVLERKGAPLAFITTQGFRTAFGLGHYARHESERYDLLFEAPEPPVPLSHCFEVPERMGASGDVLVPLDEAATAEVIERIGELGVASVAISLLHSYANPVHEQRVAAMCREQLPGVVIVASYETWPEIREYERASTTVVSAYVGPIMATYLAALEDRLHEVGIPGPVQVMESSGGVMSSSHAARRAVFTIESGPAASVVAALQVGRDCGIDNLIAFDMGGTTAKAALVRDGRADITHTFHVGGKGSFGGRQSGSGMPVKVPAIDLAEVGAGGGSIAWVDPGGALRVGPQSAGAEPGPAAYDRGGTEPTVTDANLLLGYLDPGSFAGGTMSLRPELAARAMGELCRQLGADEPVVAQAIHQIVNANMAAAVDVVTVQRGVDPTKFALFASGGAGPMHVARIAEHFGISQVVVPAASGVASAVGLLGTDLTVENVRTYPVGAEPESPTVLAEVFAELAAQGATELSVNPSAAGLVREAFVDMRYRGQSYELTVPAPFSPQGYEDVAAIQKAFFRAYEQAYGIPHDAPTEIVTLRVRVTQRVPRRPIGGVARAETDAAKETGGRPAPGGRRRAYFEELGGFAEVDVFDRERLAVGDSLSGPAIVEEPEATLIVPPAWSGTVDEVGNLVLRRDYAEEGR